MKYWRAMQSFSFSRWNQTSLCPVAQPWYGTHVSSQKDVFLQRHSPVTSRAPLPQARYRIEMKKWVCASAIFFLDISKCYHYALGQKQEYSQQNLKIFVLSSSLNSCSRSTERVQKPSLPKEFISLGTSYWNELRALLITTLCSPKQRSW